jgi:hypothetical protein
MPLLRRLVFAAAVLVVAAAVATGSETPWHTPSSSSSSSGLVAGTPHRVPADQARTGSQAEGVAPDEHAAPTWILVGVLLVGFGAVTIGMLRYRRRMQISLLTRFQRELERRSRARPARTPLVQRVADGR